MTEEDLLNRLPDVEYPATTRPVPQIVTRAHEIRRGKRLYAVGAATGVAALVTAFSVITGGLPLAGQGGAVRTDIGVAGQVTGRASAETAAECQDGGAAEKLIKMPDLVYLPSEESTGPMTGSIIGRSETLDCDHRVIQGVAYSLSDGIVSRRLSIGGPNERNWYADDGTNPVHFASEITQVSIDGTQANIYGSKYFPSGLYMFWTAPDGTSRELKSDRLSRTELAAAAASLNFGAEGVLDQGSLPLGLSMWAKMPTLGAGSAATKTSRFVQYNYRGNESSPGWEFTIHNLPSYGDAPIGGQQVAIYRPRGEIPAWWTPNDDPANGKDQGELIWQADGLEFMVRGDDAPLNLNQALTVASSVTKVDPSDPRIASQPQA